MCIAKKGRETGIALGRTKQFMVMNIFKLAEPIEVSREQLCTNKEIGELSRDDQEFLTAAIF